MCRCPCSYPLLWRWALHAVRCDGRLQGGATMRQHNPLLFVARRFALLIPQLFGISIVTFVFLHLLPGNPAYLIAGNLATPEAVRAIEHHLGLDKPLLVQY